MQILSQGSPESVCVYISYLLRDNLMRKGVDSILKTLVFYLTPFINIPYHGYPFFITCQSVFKRCSINNFFGYFISSEICTVFWIKKVCIIEHLCFLGLRKQVSSCDTRAGSSLREVKKGPLFEIMKITKSIKWYSPWSVKVHGHQGDQSFY